MQTSPISFASEVEARGIFDVGKSTFRARICAGVLPPPVKFGFRSLWPRNELDQMARAIIAGETNEQLQARVAALVDARRRAAA